MARVTRENAPVFGGKPVHPDIVPGLTAAVRREPDLWMRVKREGRVAQGWGTGVKASRGTHATGHAIDVLTAGMDDDAVRRLVESLNRAGFAAALRVVGYRLGPRLVNTTEHIHAAWRGRSNYWAVWRAIQPGAPAHIETMLAARRGG